MLAENRRTDFQSVKPATRAGTAWACVRAVRIDTEIDNLGHCYPQHLFVLLHFHILISQFTAHQANARNHARQFSASDEPCHLGKAAIRSDVDPLGLDVPQHCPKSIRDQLGRLLQFAPTCINV